MAESARIYRRTEAGSKAWDLQDARVPLDYRRILGLLQGELHFDSLRNALSARFSEAALREMLLDLEKRGLVASQAEGEQHDLDFTASLDLRSLAAVHNKR